MNSNLWIAAVKMAAPVDGNTKLGNIWPLTAARLSRVPILTKVNLDRACLAQGV